MSRCIAKVVILIEKNAQHMPLPCEDAAYFFLLASDLFPFQWFSPTSERGPFAGIGSSNPTDYTCRNCYSNNRSAGDRSCLLSWRTPFWKGKLRKNVWKEIRNILRPHQTINTHQTRSSAIYKLFYHKLEQKRWLFWNKSIHNIPQFAASIYNNVYSILIPRRSFVSTNFKFR